MYYKIHHFYWYLFNFSMKILFIRNHRFYKFYNPNKSFSDSVINLLFNIMNYTLKCYNMVNLRVC